jgi:DNA adenine methylase
MEPLYKWQGSKRRLLKYILNHVPNYNTYYEPFFGSGALFFNLEPKTAVISDVQQEPIMVLNQVKNDYKNLFYELVDIEKNLQKHGEPYYYELRQDFNECKTAAKFLGLLYYGYNGLIRFDKKGNWNVPFGKRGTNDDKQKVNISEIFNLNKLERYSNFFNNNSYKIRQNSFEDIIPDTKPGDLIFADPPYLITKGLYAGWDLKKEEKLATLLRDAHKRKVKFILTNVYIYKGNKNEELLDLYNGFYFDYIDHVYSLNQTVKDKSVKEIIIYN